MYTQLRTESKQELCEFVKQHTNSLSESRIEIRKNGNGELIAELLDCNEPAT